MVSPLTTSMTTRHILRCLGEPALIAPTGRPVEFRTRKALGLLVFLAVEGRTHLREALAELLWTRAGSQESRHSLANAISEIRRRLGRTAVETAGDKVRLRGDAVELDLQRLLAGEVLGNEVRGPLDVDGFLEGFELPDAVGFAHWKEAQRARLIPAVRDALVVLIDRARRTGDFAGLGRLGERLSRFDELSEDGIRARMESRAFAGDRLGALRLYEKWRTDLEGHLGAVPSALVEGMAMRLRRRGWERPGEADSPSIRTESWRDRPFIGRAQEYRQLYEAWEATLQGQPSHRLIVGDSGVGKSTLVERFAAVAALEGASIVRTQCHELERELPYVSASDIVKQLIDCPGASATPPEQLGELAQHIPAVARRFSHLPPPVDTKGDASRIRFSESMHSLLISAADERPVVLIIDDIHNCDDVSLSVLIHALRRTASEALLCLFIARPGELRKSPNAARIVEQASHLGLSTLALSPLSQEEATQLLDSLLATAEVQAGVADRRALLTASGGYPLVLELLVRDWRHNGSDAIALQLNAIAPGPATSSPTKETYRLVLDRLLSGLDPETRTVLHTAALLGRHLNDPAMYSLADLTASQMMHGIAHLTELRLLRDAGDGLEFANDVIRAQVYLDIPQSVRRMLHGRIADELERRITRGNVGLELDLAWHCMRAGREQEAITYLLEGAQLARQRGATHEAEFKLTSGLPYYLGHQRVQATLVLCELLQEQGRWAEVLGRLEDEPGALQTLEGQARRLTAMHRRSQLLPSELEECARIVDKIAATPHVDAATARAAVALATNMHSHSYDLAATTKVVEAVARLGQLPWDLDDRVEIALGRLKLQFGFGMSRDQREGALGELEAMARETRAHVTPSLRSYSVVSGIAALNATLGRLEEALKQQESGLALALKLDNPDLAANALVSCAHHSGWLGKYLQQRQYAEKVLKGSLREHATPYCLLQSATAYAMGSMRLGKPEGVAEAFEVAHTSLPPLRSATVDQLLLLLEADFLDQLGDTKRALERSLQAVEVGNGACLNVRIAAGSAARAGARIIRNGGDESCLGQDILTQISGWMERMELLERVQALTALLWVEEDPHVRLAHKKRLAADLRLLPRHAEVHLRHYHDTWTDKRTPSRLSSLLTPES